MSSFLTGLLARHLSRVLSEESAPDDAEELPRRLSFARSHAPQDFVAGIFTGGPTPPCADLIPPFFQSAEAHSAARCPRCGRRAQ